MSPRVLLVSALLSCCTGESPAFDPPDIKRVVAFAGGSTLLPCSIENPDGGDLPTVEWSKDGLKPSIVFLFRDGCETHEMKNRAFEHRTSFVMKNLKDGNVSLRISGIQLADAGTYKCMKIWPKSHQHITLVELVVVSLSDPELSVVSPESGGVTLRCVAQCWRPKPVISFLDDQGNDIPSKGLITQEAHGCFTVIHNVTLTTNTTSVTCRAEQLESNMSRDTKILIPVDCLRTCAMAMVVTGAVVGAVVFTVTALTCGAFVLWLKKCDRTDNPKPMLREESAESATSDASEYPLLQRNRTSTRPHQDRSPDQAGPRSQDGPATARSSIHPPPPRLTPAPAPSAQSDHVRPPLQRQNSITASAPPAAAAATAAPKKHPALISRSMSDPNHPRTLRRNSSMSSYSPLSEESEP